MDDDIASLIGLMLIVNPSCRDNPVRHANVHQLYLSLYLLAQCQMKLHHSVTSLAQTLDYVEVARRYPDDDFSLEQLLLKLTEHKVLISGVARIWCEGGTGRGADENCGQKNDKNWQKIDKNRKNLRSTWTSRVHRQTWKPIN